MSSSASSRSAATRSEARAHLLALRTARLNRRRGGAAAPPPDALDTEPDAAVATGPVSDEGAEDPGAGAPSVPQDAVLPEEDTVFEALEEEYAPAEDTNVPLPLEATTPADPPEPEALVAEDTPDSDLDIGEQDLASDHVAEADVADISASAVPSNDVSDVKDSPLAALPGAGPGLIWMLECAGVTTVEDLAASDLDTLRDALGVVGKILDLEYCITWAKEARS